MVSKSRDCFTRRLKELKEQKSTFVKQASVLHSALLASYKVAYRVSKCKNPHRITEELILLAAVDVVNIMVGESVGWLPSELPLSNSTLSRKIQHMAKGLSDHLIKKMKGKNVKLQLDDATGMLIWFPTHSLWLVTKFLKTFSY